MCIGKTGGFKKINNRSIVPGFLATFLCKSMTSGSESVIPLRLHCTDKQKKKAKKNTWFGINKKLDSNFTLSTADWLRAD